MTLYSPMGYRQTKWKYLLYMRPEKEECYHLPDSSTGLQIFLRNLVVEKEAEQKRPSGRPERGLICIICFSSLGSFSEENGREGREGKKDISQKAEEKLSTEGNSHISRVCCDRRKQNDFRLKRDLYWI